MPIETRELHIRAAVGDARADTFDFVDAPDDDASAEIVPTEQVSLNFAKIEVDYPASADDVWVDGKIITAENWDTAALDLPDLLMTSYQTSGETDGL